MDIVFLSSMLSVLSANDTGLCVGPVGFNRAGLGLGGDVEHALQRDDGVLPGLRVHGDAVDQRAAHIYIYMWVGVGRGREHNNMESTPVRRECRQKESEHLFSSGSNWESPHEFEQSCFRPEGCDEPQDREVQGQQHEGLHHQE